MTTPDLFAKYDVPVPRYTSYPTVPEWKDIPTTDQWIASLARALEPADATVSLYLHLPFCESLCTFCGCNTVITRDHGRAEPYVNLLLKELQMYLDRVPALGRRPICQMHLGGGTPTFMAPETLARLLDGIFDKIPRERHGFEGSVEADPRVTTPEHLDTLHARGFTRLSLGVQDFDAEVQRLVNRTQPFDITARLIRHARAGGYESVNCDLIYGLPGQTLESMKDTAAQVLTLRPDRLAVYSFARVPWIKPQQRKFSDEQIPAGAEKRALYDTIRRPLLDAGYIELGLDHFALPNDGLARAAAGATMHRNFQGYTERRTSTLVGFGVSAISETDDCYHQNEKIITVYDRRITKGELPTFRGHRLSADDQRRRGKILALMTGFRVRLDADEIADARQFLAPLLADGLCEIVGDELRVPMQGRPFLRNVTAFFDAHLRAAQPSGPKYSTSV
jgi:oxygen-independent coproporphyrinogen-3 oxidase